MCSKYSTHPPLEVLRLKGIAIQDHGFVFIVYITHSFIKTCAYTSNLAGSGQVDDKSKNIRTTNPRNTLVSLFNSG